MKKIVVGSKNPVKLDAVLRGFQAMFPDEAFEVEGISVPSGVRDQPMSDAETYQGAHNRVLRAREEKAGADYYAAIEGGVEDTARGMEAFAWVVLCDQAFRHGEGRTGTFFLPNAVATLVREGMELGVADDTVFGRTNSKRSNGAVGLLTGDVIDRTSFYTAAVVLALIPFKNPTHYAPEKVG